MKKLFLILTVALFSLGTVNAFAQEAEAAATEVAATEAVAAEEAAVAAETVVEGETMHHVLMQKFLEGGWGWIYQMIQVLIILALLIHYGYI